ncbi:MULTISPECIES: sensor histidine kinase [unclassified Streptomyces]|uniref:sensor histidine kinase n=1 Tax=unclassified Streptomyces TaxID=2593676 RepID=UPI000CD53722|nr:MULTISPECIES: histidine kinase [unclassified Streptomyces]
MALTSRSFLTAPGEAGRGRWRALAEVVGGALLMLMSAMALESMNTVALGPVVQIVLGVAALALFVVRRRTPATSLLGISALMSLLTAAGLLGAGLLAAVTAYTTAKLMVPSRRRVFVLLGSVGLVTVLPALTTPLFGGGSSSYGLALGFVLAATALVVPGLVGVTHGQQARLMSALGDRAAAAEEARRLADSESRIHERSRIAAEMHDLVGHRLSLISLHAGGLEMALQKESPELRDEAVLVRRATGEAMRELREVLGVLGPLGRDTGSDALTDATGTRPDIEALAEESRRVGIPVELTWDGPDLDGRPAQVRRAVHRVVREALTNVHRYAAGAHVTVAVTHTGDRVVLLVRNGLPPAPPPAATGLGTGRGLTGLRERVALLGGTLEAGPTPAGGFAVSADMPGEPDPEAVLAATDSGHDLPAYEPHGNAGFARFQRRAAGAATGLLGLAGVGVMMTFGVLLVDEARPGAAYSGAEQPRIGMSRAEVREAVWGDSPLVRAAAHGWEPPHPPSVTSCIYPMASAYEVRHEPPDPVPPAAPDSATSSWLLSPLEARETDEYRITRYCFRGDTLAVIDRFTVPTVSRTPPREAP